MAAPRRGADAVVLRSFEQPEFRSDSLQSRRVMAAAVLAVHLILGWALLQLASEQPTVFLPSHEWDAERRLAAREPLFVARRKVENSFVGG